MPAPRVETLDGSPDGAAAAREREQELELAELPADLEVGAGLGRGFDAHPTRATSGDLESGGGAAAAGAGGGAPSGRAAAEDEDVAAERARVLAGGAAGDAIALVGLRKARARRARPAARAPARALQGLRADLHALLRRPAAAAGCPAAACGRGRSGAAQVSSGVSDGIGLWCLTLSVVFNTLNNTLNRRLRVPRQVYPGPQPKVAVADLCLGVRAGERFGLLGDNGGASHWPAGQACSASGRVRCALPWGVGPRQGPRKPARAGHCWHSAHAASVVAVQPQLNKKRRMCVCGHMDKLRRGGRPARPARSRQTGARAQRARRRRCRCWSGACSRAAAARSCAAALRAWASARSRTRCWSC